MMKLRTLVALQVVTAAATGFTQPLRAQTFAYATGSLTNANVQLCNPLQYVVNPFIATASSSCAAAGGSFDASASAIAGVVRLSAGGSLVNFVGVGKFDAFALAEWEDRFSFAALTGAAAVSDIKVTAEVRGSGDGAYTGGLAPPAGYNSIGHTADVFLGLTSQINYARAAAPLYSQYLPDAFTIDQVFSAMIAYSQSVTVDLNERVETMLVIGSGFPNITGFANQDFSHTTFLRSLQLLDSQGNDVTNQYVVTSADGTVFGDPDAPVTATPEPTSLVLACTGVGSVLLARRRRKRSDIGAVCSQLPRQPHLAPQGTCLVPKAHQSY